VLLFYEKNQRKSAAKNYKVGLLECTQKGYTQFIIAESKKNNSAEYHSHTETRHSNSPFIVYLSITGAFP